MATEARWVADSERRRGDGGPDIAESPPTDHPQSFRELAAIEGTNRQVAFARFRRLQIALRVLAAKPKSSI